MREATLIFALCLLIFFVIVSYYPIRLLHVSTSILSGCILFGMLRGYDKILKMEGHDEDSGSMDRRTKS